MTTYTNAPYEKQAFTLNGSATGLITVTSTALLVEGARAFLSSSSIAPVAVYIYRIVNATTLYTKPLGVGDYNYYDVSAFTTAQGAAITQPSNLPYQGITLG